MEKKNIELSTEDLSSFKSLESKEVATDHDPDASRNVEAWNEEDLKNLTDDQKAMLAARIRSKSIDQPRIMPWQYQKKRQEVSVKDQAKKKKKRKSQKASRRKNRK